MAIFLELREELGI